jgi:hypothetical protein
MKASEKILSEQNSPFKITKGGDELYIRNNVLLAMKICSIQFGKYLASNYDTDSMNMDYNEEGLKKRISEVFNEFEIFDK